MDLLERERERKERKEREKKERRDTLPSLLDGEGEAMGSWSVAGTGEQSAKVTN